VKAAQKLTAAGMPDRTKDPGKLQAADSPEDLVAKELWPSQ